MLLMRKCRSGSGFLVTQPHLGSNQPLPENPLPCKPNGVYGDTVVVIKQLLQTVVSTMNEVIMSMVTVPPRRAWQNLFTQKRLVEVSRKSKIYLLARAGVRPE